MSERAFDAVERALDAFDFELPADRIAQHPPTERDGGRLLILERESGRIHHQQIVDLPRWLSSGDLLVRNTSRVVQARLRGHKASGGAVEVLLLGPDASGPGRQRALLKASGRLRTGWKIRFESFSQPERACDAELVSLENGGQVVLSFDPEIDPTSFGETPLPPYLRRATPNSDDVARYQTVYALQPGSVAAPTAGLHLSERLLDALQQAGIETADVVLHVGLGTFRPLRNEDLERGRLHRERIELPAETALAIAETQRRGKRVVAVGTTSTRVLESRAYDDGSVMPGSGETDLFLVPGSRFRVVDALLTNFHLPRSSLLMLVAGFAGREQILAAYAEAIREGYRFYSYGDAMLLL
ncbi:MAG: tRNA preQ1(34) S-adenosylmethionine ribosyltransferase-isomerase QueA [Myxococcales bacterium]|nr:tRNA preQ1(34) S-adenosylmethionine ribosyltransferase-isomerase QueA [Myxococcales bacterium]